MHTFLYVNMCSSAFENRKFILPKHFLDATRSELPVFVQDIRYYFYNLSIYTLKNLETTRCSMSSPSRLPRL